MWAALIPSGPLHPEDALVALAVGLFVGGLARWWTAGPALIVGAAALTLEQRHPDVLVDGVLDRPAPAWALLGVMLASACVAMLSVAICNRSMRAAGLVTLTPIAIVWALVADTEPAVVAGLVVLGAVVTGVGQPSRVVGVLALLAPFAALIGSVGRPAQLGPALIALVAVSAVTRLSLAGLDGLSRRLVQRAGTPMTVAPAGTSSVTTAPAATTAP